MAAADVHAGPGVTVDKVSITHPPAAGLQRGVSQSAATHAKFRLRVPEAAKSAWEGRLLPAGQPGQPGALDPAQFPILSSAIVRNAAPAQTDYETAMVNVLACALRPARHLVGPVLDKCGAHLDTLIAARWFEVEPQIEKMFMLFAELGDIGRDLWQIACQAFPEWAVRKMAIPFPFPPTRDHLRAVKEKHFSRHRKHTSFHDLPPSSNVPIASMNEMEIVQVMALTPNAFGVWQETQGDVGVSATYEPRAVADMAVVGDVFAMQELNALMDAGLAPFVSAHGQHSLNFDTSSAPAEAANEDYVIGLVVKENLAFGTTVTVNIICQGECAVMYGFLDDLTSELEVFTAVVCPEGGTTTHECKPLGLDDETVEDMTGRMDEWHRREFTFDTGAHQPGDGEPELMLREQFGKRIVVVWQPEGATCRLYNVSVRITPTVAPPSFGRSLVLEPGFNLQCRIDADPRLAAVIAVLKVAHAYCCFDGAHLFNLLAGGTEASTDFGVKILGQYGRAGEMALHTMILNKVCTPFP